MTEGIKPVFVFDGKPPNLKSGELLKRREKREKAEAALKVATEDNNTEEVDKQHKRLVRAGQKENADCQKLLRLMGVPVILAPCEAEAQASHLAKTGQVYATGTEDMDALTFQTPVLVRKMTFAGQSKSIVQTIHYEKAVSGLGLSYEQFVDLCILLGCDYCDSIRGVGPKTALKLIKQHGSIEVILKHIDLTKYGVPDNWLPPANADSEPDSESPPPPANDDFVPVYVQARKLFFEHEVIDRVDLKWKPCQEEELKKFLVDDMGFNPERVQANIEKLNKARAANAKPQARMDSFFKVKVNPNNAKIAAKRKAEKDAAKKQAAKKKKAAKKK